MTVITNSHIERTLRHITLRYDGRTFTDWVVVARINSPRKSRRLSDDLVYDLKRDDTLPETFDSLDGFRSYLISQSACGAALSLAPKGGRYRRWALKAVRS
jgi:hypothetical protein